MGMAGIKWWPCLSTRPSFSVNINEEAFLKVSFKNIDWFQIWKNYFFQKGPKNKQILKNLKFFFAFLFAFSMDFSMVYCLFSYPQCTEGFWLKFLSSHYFSVPVVDKGVKRSEILQETQIFGFGPLLFILDWKTLEKLWK